MWSTFGRSVIVVMSVALVVAGLWLWTHAGFLIPSDSPTVPKGWKLQQAPDGYTWADMMRNIDAVKVYAYMSPLLQPGACFHYGADNVVVTYATPDLIFADDFDGSGTENIRQGIVRDPSFESTQGSGGANEAWESSDSNPAAQGGSILYRSDDTGIVPRHGHYAAFFGGWNAGSEIQYVSQTVTLPNTNALYLNYHRETIFQVDTDVDFVVKVDGTVVESTDLWDAGDMDYVAHSVDIGAFADGNPHEIRFEYDYDDTASLSDGATLLDDVSIDALPIAKPSPAP